MLSRYLIERPLLKTTALIAVGFMLLASARTIVPKVCATQAALASCHESAPTPTAHAAACCPSEPVATSIAEHQGAGEITQSAVHCGLCVLATGIVLPLAQNPDAAPITLPVTAPRPMVDAPALPILWSPALARDPPAAA